MYTIDIQSITTDIHAYSLNQKINVNLYPNPVSDYVSIVCNQKIETVSLYSIDGKLVLKTSSNHIDLSSLATGTYFAEISLPYQKITKQLIKQ